MSENAPAIALDFEGPFTIDEIDEIERLARRPINRLLLGERAESIRAVAFVVGRRDNPSLTMAEASKMWVKVEQDNG